MLILTMLFFATSAGQGKPDEAAIRNSLREDVAAWNMGDAQAYFAAFRRGWHIREYSGDVLHRAPGVF
jgi:hypothetical protein